MFVRLPRWCVGDVRAGFDESFGVALDFRWQPVGARSGADHGKNGRCSDNSAFASVRIFQFDLFQLFSARHFADLGLVKDLDVVAGLHPTGKIVRHLHTVSPNEKEYFGRALGKEHRRLARRVSTPGDNNRFIAAKLTFHRSRRVVNAHPLKLFTSLGFEPAMGR